MKKVSIVVICVFTMCVFSVTVKADININFDSVADGTTLTTPYNFGVVETFDNVLSIPEPVNSATGFDQLWDWSGNGQVVQGSLSGAYAAPGLTDITNYMAVPQYNSGTLSVSVEFGITSNYLGLYWGSIDQYNYVQFFLGDMPISGKSVWTGLDVSLLANGDQSAVGTNKYVNFLNVPDFDKVVFTSMSGHGGSSPFAFEFDNVAVNVVPIPATILLGLIGLGVGGWKLRKSM